MILLAQVGGSVAKPIYGVPVAVGGDLMSIPDTDLNTKYYGLTGNLGFGTKGSEMHFEWGETYTVPGSKFNIFDIARTIYHGIMEW